MTIKKSVGGAYKGKVEKVLQQKKLKIDLLYSMFNSSFLDFYYISLHHKIDWTPKIK